MSWLTDARSSRKYSLGAFIIFILFMGFHLAQSLGAHASRPAAIAQAPSAPAGLQPLEDPVRHLWLHRDGAGAMEDHGPSPDQAGKDDGDGQKDETDLFLMPAELFDALSANLPDGSDMSGMASRRALARPPLFPGAMGGGGFAALCGPAPAAEPGRLPGGNDLQETQGDTVSATGKSDELATGRVVASVPEPSAWIMMILGLGAVGAIFRRSKTAPVSVRLQLSRQAGGR